MEKTELKGILGVLNKMGAVGQAIATVITVVLVWLLMNLGITVPEYTDVALTAEAASVTPVVTVEPTEVITDTVTVP